MGLHSTEHTTVFIWREPAGTASTMLALENQFIISKQGMLKQLPSVFDFRSRHHLWIRLLALDAEILSPLSF